MKAACIYIGVIGQQYVPSGSCSCGCSRAAETGSACFDFYPISSTSSLSSFHLLQGQQEGCGHLEQGPPEANIMKLSGWWVFVNLVEV